MLKTIFVISEHRYNSGVGVRRCKEQILLCSNSAMTRIATGVTSLKLTRVEFEARVLNPSKHR
jgi:hypothetical protein